MASTPPTPARIPVTFQVGTHLVRVGGRNGVWAVSVDGVDLDHTFATEAEAWEAGVREADRVDRAGKP